MEIVIIEKIDHVQTYLPGQVVVNHAKEREWLRAGLAKPMVDFTLPDRVKPPRFAPYADSAKT
jgi:hypothetical protein